MRNAQQYQKTRPDLPTYLPVDTNSGLRNTLDNSNHNFWSFNVGCQRLLIAWGFLTR